MPRDVLQIERFDNGIISSPDPDDIPNDAATYDLDIDGVLKPGELTQRKADEVLSIQAAQYTEVSELIVEDDGKRTLISHNSNTGNIESLEDVFGSAVDKDLVTPTVLGEAGSSPTMVRHNKEVHIGMGSGSLDVPKWVGRATAKQFGGGSTTNRIFVNAELTYPASVPFFHKTIWDGTYLYGFELGSDRLYKIKVSTGDITVSALGIFKSLTAICLDDGGSHLWIYDGGASTYGTIYKILLSDLSIVYTTTLGVFPLLPDMYVSDMILVTIGGTTPSIVFALYHPLPMTLDPGYEGFLFKIPLPVSSGGTPTPTNITPCLHARTQAGQPHLDGDVVTPGVPAKTRIQELYKLGLVRFTTSLFGWVLHVASPTKYHLSPTGTETTVDLHSFIYSLTGLENPAVTNSNFAPVVLFDILDTNISADGFVFDSLANKIFWGTGKFLHSHSLTIPTVIGTATDISSGITTSSALSYSSAPSQLYGTGPATIFLTRRDGIPGVDSINSSFASFTTLFNGAQVSIAPTDSAEVGVFEDNTTYFYKACFLYDGYQHSPLSINTSTKINGAGNTFGASIVITIQKIDTISPRVSDILIFRSQGGVSASTPSGFYRFAISIPLSDQRWVVSGTTATITILDNSLSGASYEASSGMPETLPDSMVHYAISAELNNQMFVAKCYHPDIPDANHFIFKSKSARYDMFDWSTDFLRLPIIPTAMAGFAGRLFVFDENWTYKINPEGMYVEDTYEGGGCLGQHSVLVTDVGMFYCNKNGVYLHDGKFPRLISGQIGFASTSANTIQWTSLGHTNYAPKLGYLAKESTLLIAVSDTTDLFFAYNVPLSRWDLWSNPDTERTHAGFFSGPNGELYWGAGYSWKIATNESLKKPAVWYSKKFSLGDPSQVKKFYKVRALSQGTLPAISYALDESETYTPLSTEVFSPFPKAKSIRFKVLFTPSSGSLESLSVIYRSLIGKR